MTKIRNYLAILAFSTFAGASTFGCNTPEPPPDLDTCESCDDGNPCTSEACVAGVCERGWVTPGVVCQDAPGFCDSDGVCREECPREPCFDATIEEGRGCVYTRRPNGWTCKTAFGVSGVCRDEACITTTTGEAS